MLALVVITLNERDRLEACLSSVPAADEVVVVDSGSTDGTPELAERLGARVVRTDWPGHVAQKNRALELARSSWVLSLDADERLSATAHAAMVAALRDPGPTVGFGFARCSRWQGRYLRYGRWYPDRKLRLVRRGHGRWSGQNPHDRLAIEGPVRWIDGDILHDPYRSLGEHLATVDRYSSTAAREIAASGARVGPMTPWARSALHFVDGALWRLGVLDGWRGLAVAGLGARATYLKWARARALRP